MYRMSISLPAQMFPTSRIGKAMGNEPERYEMKARHEACVNIMLLTPYQLVDPSEFDKGEPIDGYS